MILIECPSCGSREMVEGQGRVTCAFCRTDYTQERQAGGRSGAAVDLLSDVELLLQKCESDPRNRQRYVGLILDIDPANSDVVKYLK